MHTARYNLGEAEEEEEGLSKAGLCQLEQRQLVQKARWLWTLPSFFEVAASGQKDAVSAESMNSNSCHFSFGIWVCFSHVSLAARRVLVEI